MQLLMSARLSWRAEIVSLLPWVRRLTDREVGLCEGYRRSSMPLKALCDPELRERYRCSNLARWRYRYLDSANRAGRSPRREDLCYAHLCSSAIDGSREEEERCRRWWDRHLEEVDEVRVRHGLAPMSSITEAAAARDGDA